MKRLQLILLLIGLYTFSVAQEIKSPVITGNITHQKELSNKNVSFNVGSAIPYTYGGGSSQKLQVGFPYNALYLDRTFPGNLFVSKGYFPNFIQLRWEVANNAEKIDRFEVYRKKLGDTDSVWVDNVTAEARKWEDNYAEANEVYQYTIKTIGIPGGLVEGYTYISGVGFRSPLATVTGRVTYSGGTGSSGVTITATTDDDIPASSIQLSGGGHIVVPQFIDMDIESAFSFQTYIKFNGLSNAGIFEKTGNYKLTYESGKFRFYVGSEYVEYAYAISGSEFVHVSAVYNGDSAFIYIPGQYVDPEGISHDTVFNAGVNIAGTIANNDNDITFGKTNGLGFNGNIDEIRMWDRALEPTEILSDYNRYISSKKPGLLGYWRINEGFGQAVYDISKEGTVFNENHGYFTGSSVLWSEDYPTTAQLGYKGITDLEGNYIIAGIPFLTDGSAYKFTPMLAPHYFQPEFKILFLNEDANVHNNIDFTDLASVSVSINAIYNTGTGYPVGDILVKLDGNYLSDENNNIVKTKEDGTVDFRVPIGNHYLSFEKNGHTLQNAFFPGKDSLGNIERHLFDQNIPLLTVIDTTRVIFAGRIVGGPVEAAKTMGSTINPSKNNIGVVTVNLTTEKGYDIETDGTPKSITFSSDPVTGEFEVRLLPEKYKPNSTTAIRNSRYVFNSDNDLALIDLSNQFLEKYETDSVFIMNYLGELEFDKLDTTASYNLRKDWVYRSDPSIEMTNLSGSKIISEQKYVVSNEASTDTVDVAIEELNGSITYPFGFPIFIFAKYYFTKITSFEEYINPALAADSIDRVPVTDGVVLINNDLALDNKKQELELNEKGEVRYRFIADFPNIAAPYTKNLNVSLKTKATIKQLPTLEAYIMGGRPTGNNFVTNGPNDVDFILRDPPGSESSAFLEKGYTSYTTKSSSVANGEEGDATLAFQMGVRMSTTAGSPVFAVQTEFETDNFLGVTFEHSYNDEGGYETNTSTSFGETFSTSDGPDFVGADGDVFIGHSTNIVYGISKMMDIMPKMNVPSYSDTISKYGNYAISIENGLRVNPEFNTMFVYSQKIIEEEIIPNIKYLRNIVIEGPHYTKVLNDFGNELYASNNDDVRWSGSVSADPYNGPSYIYDPPAPVDPLEVIIDSVRMYNQQIKNWKELLALNEKQKLAAKPDQKHKNISFGAGSTYEAYIGSEYDSVYTNSWEFTVAPGIATSIGFSLNKFGFRADLNQKYTHSESESTGNGSTSSKTVGYSLVDGDQYNYLTVDVLKDVSGNGPVFVKRGGQTSCPYEDQELTKYFEPGTRTLSYATMKIEGPQISVDNPVSPLIPETSPAYFTLNLSNVSEAGKDNWYIIGVDVASNPDGAKIMMDGAAINSGIAVFVPYGGDPVIKTIEVYKGRADVNEYENLTIYLASTCDKDVYETVDISAYFASACSPVSFVEPNDNWIINVNDHDSMLVVFDGFNLQHDGFNDIHFQYKPSGSSLWTTVQKFTNNVSDTTSIYINNQTTINYLWDMSSLMDRGYELRLVSHCEDGSVNYSKTLTGILDGQRPQVFGSPQPADGILDVDDDISVQFNEPIEKGLLIPAKFNLNGTINNGAFLHTAYVRYDGNTNYSVIPEGISFNDKSFSVEFWMQTNQYKDAVLFAQGNDPSNNIEIGITADKNIYFKIGSISSPFEVPLVFTSTVPENTWHHIGVVYDYENGDLLLYQNDKELFSARGISTTVATNGKIYVGKSAVDGSHYFNGVIHELRVWSKPLDFGDFNANQYNSQTGNEVGLYGYWPMDESFGEFAIDKASNRHMEIFANWKVDPGGSAWNFSGNNFLEFATGYFAIIPEMDYTMEFWFKSSLPTDTVTLFSNQKGDGNEGTSLMEKALSVFATPDGKLWVASKGNVFQASSNNYFDNSWHHFSLVVRRRGNVISYIDGQAQNETGNGIMGGIAGGKMFLGARKWNNLMGAGEDQYFSGKLDEFRLWNLAKSTTQIRMDMNSKLKGDEVGLMVYLPFEGYFEDAFGALNLDPTLKNYVSDNNASDAIPQTPNAFTADAPNIKDVRPKQDISFDFVASDDKIILNPKEFLMTQLEKNIIEITVEGVEDKFGNRMASPVTWTAYVHRNQVRWEDERRLFSKAIYETLQFVSSIKNTGGQQIGFSINNLPPWLTASPASGVINPESTLEITFTINPALNIGEYNEDIVLHTENGFDEKLPITVRVHKPAPDWKVDPGKFEYSMNIVGKIKIEGILSTDIFDKVAAFVNDSIRGVANLRYVEDFDSYLVFLTIYGDSLDNANNRNIDFRIWDASAGQILDQILPDTVNFELEEILGSTVDPLVFEANGLFRQNISLAKGWNWVSFNKRSSKRGNLNNFFSALEPELNDQIKTRGAFVNYTTTGWDFGNLDSIDHRWMYQIKSNSPDTIIYSGEEIIPEDNPIPLYAGWNYIGYLPDLAMDVNDALRLYNRENGDVIKSQFAFAMYDERAGWLGNLEVMQPNYGYKFKVQKNDSLKYPNSTVFKGVKISQYTSPPTGWNSNLAEYEGNMSIVAKLDVGNNQNVSINSEMVLGAFINNECRGFISPITNVGIGYEPFFLNVSGSSNGQTIKFMVFDGITGLTYNVSEIKPFVTDAVYGSTTEPQVLTLKQVATGTGEFNNQKFLHCYPNPFSGHINIEFTGINNELTIDVLNATGSLVKRIYNGYPAGGINKLTWDGNNQNGTDVSAGIYYIRSITENSVETIKISKTR